MIELTATTIAALAFNEFIKSGAGEIAKKSLYDVIDPIKRLCDCTQGNHLSFSLLVPSAHGQTQHVAQLSRCLLSFARSLHSQIVRTHSERLVLIVELSVSKINLESPTQIITAMQVKDLTTEELKSLIRETVMETLEELLNDPDEGKEIRPEVQQQLIESLKQTQAGERGIPATEVAKRLGLVW